MIIDWDENGKISIGAEKDVCCELCGKESDMLSEITVASGNENKETIRYYVCEDCSNMIVNYFKNKKEFSADDIIASLDNNTTEEDYTPAGNRAACKLLIDECLHDFGYASTDELLEGEMMDGQGLLDYLVKDLARLLGVITDNHYKVEGTVKIRQCPVCNMSTIRMSNSPHYCTGLYNSHTPVADEIINTIDAKELKKMLINYKPQLNQESKD